MFMFQIWYKWAADVNLDSELEISVAFLSQFTSYLAAAPSSARRLVERSD